MSVYASLINSNESDYFEPCEDHMKTKYEVKSYGDILSMFFKKYYPYMPNKSEITVNFSDYTDKIGDYFLKFDTNVLDFTKNKNKRKYLTKHYSKGVVKQNGTYELTTIVNSYEELQKHYNGSYELFTFVFTPETVTHIKDNYSTNNNGQMIYRYTIKETGTFFHGILFDRSNDPDKMVTH